MRQSHSKSLEVITMTSRAVETLAALVAVGCLGYIANGWYGVALLTGAAFAAALISDLARGCMTMRKPED